MIALIYFWSFECTSGNSAVIFVALQKKKYRNVTNCYIVNLAIADLLFLTVSIPYTTYLGLVNTYPFDGTLCNIYTYLAYVGHHDVERTRNILSAWSEHRYFSWQRAILSQWWVLIDTFTLSCPEEVFDGVHHRMLFSLRWPFGLVSRLTGTKTKLSGFSAAIALIIPYHLISHSLAPNSRACGVNNHENFLVCFFVFCSYYAIPLMIIIICYSKLAAHVIRSNQLITSHMIPVGATIFAKDRCVSVAFLFTSKSCRNRSKRNKNESHAW